MHSTIAKLKTINAEELKPFAYVDSTMCEINAKPRDIDVNTGNITDQALKLKEATVKLSNTQDITAKLIATTLASTLFFLEGPGAAVLPSSFKEFSTAFAVSTSN